MQKISGVENIWYGKYFAQKYEAENIVCGKDGHI